MKTAKRVFYQQEIADFAAANAKDNGSGSRVNDKKERLSEKKSGKNEPGRDAPHQTARRENLSNWTAGIFQPGYAGRSLHDAQRLL